MNRPFWGCILCVLLFTNHADAKSLPETTLVLNKTWTKGSVTAFNVTTAESTDYFSAVSVASQCVAVLRQSAKNSAEGSEWPLVEFETDPAAETTVAVDVPTLPKGSYELAITCLSASGESKVTEHIQLTDSTTIYIVTDRPQYRPGQTIRVRLSVLRPADHRPSPSQSVQLVLRDPRKTAVWQQSITTNNAGFAIAEIGLTDDLLTGTYRLDANVGAEKKSLEIEIRAEKNPPFSLTTTVTPNQAGGLNVSGTARYFYGEPVLGNATVYYQGDNGQKQELVVDLDSNGGFTATIPRPIQDITDPVLVSVEDEAGRQRSQNLELPSDNHDWSLTVLPQTDKIGSGASSHLTVCTMNQAGVLVPVILTITLPGQATKTLSSQGIIRVPFAAPAPRRTQSIRWETTSWTVESKTMQKDLPQFTDATTDAILGALAECVPYDDWAQTSNETTRHVVVTLELTGQSVRVQSVMDEPFFDSPNFLTTFPSGVRECVERKLRRVSAKSFNKTTVLMRVSLSPKQVETVEPTQQWTIRVHAKSTDGTVKNTSTQLEVVTNNPTNIPILESSVIDPGDEIRLRLFNTTARHAVLVRRQATIAAGPCVAGADGFTDCRIVPPTGVWGLATVGVVDTASVDDQKTTQLNIHTKTSLFLRPQVVHLTIDIPERVRPGTMLSFPVQASLPSGQPAAGVGLAASIIDEAALSLGPRFPSLMEALADAESQKFDRWGTTFAQLLHTQADNSSAALAMDAILNELPTESVSLWANSTLGERREKERSKLSSLREQVYATLTQYPEAFVKAQKDAQICDYTVSMNDILTRAGLDEGQRHNEWSLPYRFEDAERLDRGYVCPHVARHVSYRKLEKLATWLDALPRNQQKLLKKNPTRTWAIWLDQQRIPTGLFMDAWGHQVTVRYTEQGLQVRTAGGDGRLDTPDDLIIDDVLQESVGHHGFGVAGYGMGAGGSAFGSRSVRSVASIIHGESEPDAVAAVRKRFDETVLWSADTWTDASGLATLETTLADSITRWAVTLDAMAPDGSVGYAQRHVETFLPQFVDLSVPDYLTEGDVYLIPTQLANYTGRDQRWTLATEFAGTVLPVGTRTEPIAVQTGHVGATTIAVRAAKPGVGTIRVHLIDENGDTKDTIEKTIPVVAPGLIQRAVYSLPRAGDQLMLQFSVPPNARPETLGGKLRLFRDALDGARDGLEGLLREPNGCFEQTSSTTYPNLLILKLLGSREDKAELRAKATDLVARGYQKLLRFEVPNGGFSWFGDAPANRVLTAYGLVEFVDMQKVVPIDSSVIERTQKWLLSQQNPNGSFSPDKSWLHDWSAVQGEVSTTAYISWALAEAGHRGTSLTKALRFLETHRKEIQNNPYLLGLWARAATIAEEDASFPLQRLRSMTQKEGGLAYVPSVGKTLLYGNNISAHVEVTALAATSRFLANEPTIAHEHIEWLWKNRHATYGWGTTQATVMALRAMAEIEQGHQENTDESTTILLDGQKVGTMLLTGDQIPTFNLAELATNLTPGLHTLSTTAKAPVRGEMRLTWFSKEPNDAVNTGLGVVMSLSYANKTTAKNAQSCPAGTEIGVRIGIQNPTDTTIAMPTVVFPLAPGYIADSDSLAKLVKSGLAEKYENHGDRVVLYVSSLAANQAQVFDFKVVSQASAIVVQPAAQAYAYYDPDTAGASRSERIGCTAQDDKLISTTITTTTP
ncbi:MAG: hypothetical protein HUU55_13665 [Myxococcales bacterium]|nr:hypothetical protein [Myxococcales bacterium]